jgi:ATP-dependent Clp protease adaptor protein ClpS
VRQAQPVDGVTQQQLRGPGRIADSPSTFEASVLRFTRYFMPPNERVNPERDDGLAIAERPKTKRPRKYVVVFHNDDYTTMEFVVLVLQKFFYKSETEATQIMLHVHHKGYGIVGLFTRDVAETKASQVMDFAKEHGHPLRCTAEPEGAPEQN